MWKSLSVVHCSLEHFLKQRFSLELVAKNTFKHLQMVICFRGRKRIEGTTPDQFILVSGLVLQSSVYLCDLGTYPNKSGLPEWVQRKASKCGYVQTHVGATMSTASISVQVNTDWSYQGQQSGGCEGCNWLW